MSSLLKLIWEAIKKQYDEISMIWKLERLAEKTTGRVVEVIDTVEDGRRTTSTIWHAIPTTEQSTLPRAYEK